MPEISTAGIFQVAFIARQMEQTPRAFFQTAFEPIGRVCAARHARGGVELQGKWRTRACVPHTPYMRATACRTTCFPCRTLNSSRYPVLSPRGRELERGQQAARLVFWAVGVFGKDCRNLENALSPALPHGGGSGLQQVLRLQVV